MLVRGPGLKFNFKPGSGQVSHLWFGFGIGKFPFKIQNLPFSSKSTRVNVGSGPTCRPIKPGNFSEGPHDPFSLHF